MSTCLTVDNAQSHVTAFRPISEAARSWSDDKSVMTPEFTEASVMTAVDSQAVPRFTPPKISSDLHEFAEVEQTEQ